MWHATNFCGNREVACTHEPGAPRSAQRAQSVIGFLELGPTLGVAVLFDRLTGVAASGLQFLAAFYALIPRDDVFDRKPTPLKRSVPGGGDGLTEIPPKFQAAVEYLETYVVRPG